MAEGRRPNPDEREKWQASLSPEQKARYDQFRDRMRQSMAGGGGPGGGRTRPQTSQDGPITRTIYKWVPQKEGSSETPAVQPVTVKLGITDGGYYELLEGLEEGDVVVIGTRSTQVAGSAAPAPATGTRNLFGGGRPR